jgi:hypothetical protein
VSANVSFPTEDGAYTDANWGPQDASHPVDGAATTKTVTIKVVQSLLGYVVFRMGGPVCWGCMRKKGTVSRSSCESEIYATDEGTKSVLTVHNLLSDFGFPDGTDPTPVWNDNRGCVDWTKGVTVSKKLRHINMRELGVRLSQKKGDVNIQHIDGKRNIADIFTKEMKDTAHFQKMAFTITSPRLVADMSDLTLSDPLVIEGGVKSNAAWTKVMTSSWIPSLVRKTAGQIQVSPSLIFGRRAI